jgi:phosphoribosyl 1,2-cyclic phosphate phosphodiesterase
MIACGCAVCTSPDKKDKRLRTSVLVQSATTTIVIDTTPDFRCQMLRANVKNLDAVLYTHSHKDHTAGMDDVRAYNFFQGRSMPVYATQPTINALMCEFSYVFADKKYPGVPHIELNEIGMKPFVIGDIPIIPVLVWHLKMPVLGFRFGSFTYITDANKIDAEEKEKIKGTKVLVLNALRNEPHISHYTLTEAIGVAQELEVEAAYFTHISHQLGRHQEVEQNLPARVHLAWDGLVLHV